MSVSPRPGGLGDRLERAVLVLLGAVALGPLLPGAVFSLMTLGARLVPDGPTSAPAEPFWHPPMAVLVSAYADGGGLVAAVSGGAAAALILLRGRVGLGTLQVLALVAALAVGWTALHQKPRRYGLPLVGGFALVAVVSARVLGGVGRRFHLLEPLAYEARMPLDFVQAPSRDRVEP